MAERSVFRVRQVGDYWAVRRSGTAVDTLRYRSKEQAVSGAFHLAEAFKPSVVIVHHKHGPPTRRAFG